MRRLLTLGGAMTAASALFAPAAGAWSSRPSGPALGCKTAAQRFVEQFCSQGPALDGDNGNIWHTESLGVSMLAAAQTRNERLFTVLDQSARSVRRPDGLHSWKVAKGTVADRNNATDGDIFIAWAYLLAAKAFPQSRAGFGAAGDQTLAAIAKHCIRSSSHGVVILPGVDGFLTEAGDVRTINLSYWVYPALQAFAQHDPKGPWAHLMDSGRKITGYAHFGDYGLPPDWLELSNPVRPDARLSTRFSYDAMRVPLYLHAAGYADHPAVERCQRFFQTTQKTWADLVSNQLSPYGLDPSSDIVLRQLRSTRQHPASLRALPNRYYPASLAVLVGMSVCDGGSGSTPSG